MQTFAGVHPTTPIHPISLRVFDRLGRFVARATEKDLPRIAKKLGVEDGFTLADGAALWQPIGMARG